MATHSFELHGVKVGVVLPDMPEGTEVKVEVEILTEDADAGAAIFRALGGRDVFQKPYDHGDTTARMAMLQPGKDNWTYGPLEVALSMPNGRPAPIEKPPPLVAELFAEPKA